MRLFQKLLLGIVGLAVGGLIGIPLAAAAVTSMVASATELIATAPATISRSIPWSDPDALAVLGAVGLGVLFVGDRVVNRLLGLSPIALLVLVAQLLSSDPAVESGREVFDETVGDRLKRVTQRAGLDVDDVMMRAADAEAAAPVLEDETSMAISGMSGRGKSAFVKGRMTKWSSDATIIAHAVAEDDGRNEMEEHLKHEMNKDIVRLSSRDSTHRWDPFMDNPENMQSMERISKMLNASKSTVETGWSETAANYLTACIAVTSVEYSDFAYLTDVLASDPADVVDAVGQMPQGGLLSASLSGSDLDPVQSTLLNDLSEVLYSEIFDSGLPRLSLRDMYADPDGRSIVLNNWLGDDFADPFFRFVVESAIDLSFETATYQYFLLDEVDKLPYLKNLHNLSSAGRSANGQGIIVFQNKSQMVDVYGDEHTETIWSNAANRVSFRCGDRQTANLVLSSLGQAQLRTAQISGNGRQKTSTQGYEDKSPIPSNRLTQLTTGEALVVSPKGWWLCDLTDSGY